MKKPDVISDVKIKDIQRECEVMQYVGIAERRIAFTQRDDTYKKTLAAVCEEIEKNGLMTKLERGRVKIRCGNIKAGELGDWIDCVVKQQQQAQLDKILARFKEVKNGS